MKKIWGLVLVISLFSVFCASRSHAESQKVTTRLYLPLTVNTSLVKEGNEESLLVKDYLGSTKMVSSKGEFSEQSYFPYGKEATKTDTRYQIPDLPAGRQVQVIDNSQTDKGFTGHRSLGDSGIIHMAARFYNPQTGTFIQPDTVEGMNRYAYVDGKPIINNDPSGHMSMGSEADGGGHWMRREKEPTLINKVDLEISQIGLYSLGSLTTKMLKTVSGIGYNPDRDWNLHHEASLNQFRLRDELGRGLSAGMPPMMGSMQLSKTFTVASKLETATSALTPLQETINKIPVPVQHVIRKPMTVYRGMSAEEFGNDLVPVLNRGSSLPSIVDDFGQLRPARSIEEYLQQLEPDQLVWSQVSGNGLKPGISWSRSLEKARRMGGDGGVVVKADLMPGEAVNTAVYLRSQVWSGQSNYFSNWPFIAEREITTFGIFPKARYELLENVTRSH